MLYRRAQRRRAPSGHRAIDGNEHVLQARFADADFFYHKDIRQPLEAFLPDLKKLTVPGRPGLAVGQEPAVWSSWCR